MLAAKIAVAEERVNFLYFGKALSNSEAPLVSYGIKPDSVIHVLLSRVEDGSVQSVQETSREQEEMERQLSSLMEMPFMKSMLEDPDRLRSLLQMNPQMKAVMEKNPELAAVFKDDKMLKEISRYMMNPALRRELMRNNDRALANIETLPGGWDALQYASNLSVLHLT